MNLRIFENTGDLMAAAAEAVIAQTAEGAVIALSGGTTPAPLYDALGRDPRIRERRITWVMVDERHVPPDHPQSNAAMIRRTLFADGIPAAHHFLPFRTELDDPVAVSRKFEREWRDHGIERIDLAILGAGNDGHTASLFPGTSALEVTDRIATEVWVESMNMWRVTLTLPVLQEARLRFVLAAGEGKREMIAAVRGGADFPVARVMAAGGETWWFVDRTAVPLTS